MLVVVEVVCLMYYRFKRWWHGTKLDRIASNTEYTEYHPVYSAFITVSTQFELFHKYSNILLGRKQRKPHQTALL